MIKVYSGIKGLAVMLFLIAGLVLFFSIFFWGISKAAELLLPLLTVLSYALILVFVLGFLPAVLLKGLRGKLSGYALLMSHALGASTWMMSFFFITKAFGSTAVFLCLFFQFLAPIALLGALFKGSWLIAGHLAVWISFTYLMRYYSRRLMELSASRQERGDIIDVEVIDVTAKEKG